MDHISTKFCSIADCHRTPAFTVGKLHHPVREPTCTVDIIPALTDQSFLSGGKLSEAGYIYIYNGKEVNIYYVISLSVKGMVLTL